MRDARAQAGERPWLDDLIAAVRREHLRRRALGIPQPPSDIIEVAIPWAIWRRLPAWLRNEAELVGELVHDVNGCVCFETTVGRYRDWLARLSAEGWRAGAMLP